MSARLVGVVGGRVPGEVRLVPRIVGDRHPWGIAGGATVPDSHRVPVPGPPGQPNGFLPKLDVVDDTPAPDRCPGVLRVFPAADGGIARLRFPGGRLRPDHWATLADLAADHGGELHLTSRGNIQVRGVHDESLLQDRVRRAGLLPAAEHDRVRNILASPMAGRLDGRSDLGDLPEALDTELLARGELAGLSGRFLFGFDDGSGDVLAHRPDLTAVVDGPSRTARIVVAGRDSGVGVDPAGAAALMADLAGTFLSTAAGRWRIPSTGDLADVVHRALRGHPDTRRLPAAVLPEAPAVPQVGWFDTTDGLVSLLAVAPFGVVPARLAEFLSAVPRPSTVSADKVIGLHGLTEEMAEQVVRVLAPMGLVFDQGSHWVEVTACTGSPGCDRSLTDVRYDAAEAIAGATLPVAGAQHWVGCERGCGFTGRGARVTATEDGYRVDRPEERTE